MAEQPAAGRGLTGMALLGGVWLPSPFGFVFAALACVFGVIAGMRGSRWWFVLPAGVLSAAVTLFVRLSVVGATGKGFGGPEEGNFVASAADALFERVLMAGLNSGLTLGLELSGDGRGRSRVARDAHPSDDEAVARMGHPAMGRA